MAADCKAGSTVAEGRYKEKYLSETSSAIRRCVFKSSRYQGCDQEASKLIPT